MRIYLGIDIGGTAVKIGIVNEVGEVLTHTEARVDFDAYVTPIIETVIKTVHDFLKSNTLSLTGIAVSAAGQIDVSKGRVIGTCGNLPNYIGSDFKDRFQEEFNLPCTVVNDANCMILGEKWIGACQNHSDVVGITLGTGVGGGVLVNNQILLGHRGLAGEIGHFILQRKGALCTCGNQGCFEPLVASSYLIRRVKEMMRDVDDVDGHWVFNQAKLGNPIILSILDEWTDAIADGIVSLVHIFNPSCVVIGGGVSAQEELLIEPVIAKVLNRVMPRFADDLKIVAAQLKNHAGLVGAVHYFIQNN